MCLSVTYIVENISPNTAVYYIKYYFRATCFDSFLSHLQALQETDPSLLMFMVHSGIPNAYNRWYSYCKNAYVFSYNVYAIYNGLKITNN